MLTVVQPENRELIDVIAEKMDPNIIGNSDDRKKDPSNHARDKVQAIGGYLVGDNSYTFTVVGQSKNGPYCWATADTCWRSIAGMISSLADIIAQLARVCIRKYLKMS